MSRTTKKPRRKVHVVILAGANGTTVEKLIRAYDTEAAADYFTRRGYRVISSKERTFKFNQFKLNTLAIREAQKFFNLAYPVSIKITNHKNGRNGAYCPGKDGLSHEIIVKSWLTPQEASETLWHELTHAMQAEREQQPHESNMLPGWRRSLSREKGQYRNAPSELEAKRYEKRAAEFPLARSTR